MPKQPFLKENRLDKITVHYKNSITIKYKHKCRHCGCDVWKTKREEEIATGYCTKCFHIYVNRINTSYDDNGNKECNICLRKLPINKFIKRKGKNKTCHSTACSKCHNLKEFKISSIDFEYLLKKQNGLCGICGLPEIANDKHKDYKREMAVDHDHLTGKIRGLLCTNCNLGIGHFKDDDSKLWKAILYLKKHKA